MKRAAGRISPPPTKARRILNLAPTIPVEPLGRLKQDEFRVITWNVNGIAPLLQKPITSFFHRSTKSRSSEESEPIFANLDIPLRECLRRWHWPQVVCLQEVKIAPRDSATQDLVRTICFSSDPDIPAYKAHFSLPRDKFNAKGFGGKVYGVCTLLRADQALDFSPLDAPDWDREGRVQIIQSSKLKLVVINVYAVNGTENPYRDPESGQITGTRHTWKRQFHTHLAKLVGSFKNQGFRVIVAGDINISRGPLDGFPGRRMGVQHVENRRDFEEKFMSDQADEWPTMIDSFRHLHPEMKRYSYHSPSLEWGSSCDRVDMILTSKCLERNIVAADILESKLERGPSDHLPCYLLLSKLSKDTG